MAEEIVDDNKKDDDWMQKKWRPAIGWAYIACCLCDFCIFPIMFTIVQFWETQAANDAFRQWVPITLQGGGLFHISMGAVLGVSSYGRTQEKLNGTAVNPTPVALQAGLPTQTIAPTPAPMPVAQATGNVPLATPAPVQSAPVAPQSAPPVVAGFGGKLAPPPAEQPLI